MSVARVLDLVRGGISPRIVERAVDGHAGGGETDHAHRQAFGLTGRDGMQRNLEREILRGDSVGIRVVAVRGVGGRDRKTPGRLADRQSIAGKRERLVAWPERERRIRPQDASRDMGFGGRIPGVAVDPRPRVPRTAATEAFTTRVHVAGGRARRDVSSPSGRRAVWADAGAAAHSAARSNTPNHDARTLAT
jgi:hypothetical protein